MTSRNGNPDRDDMKHSTGGRFSRWMIPSSIEGQEVVDL